MKPERLAEIKENIRLLHQTFEVLKALVAERERARDGVSYSDVFNISLVSKYVYERMEKEVRLLPFHEQIVPNSPLASTIRG